MIQTVWHEGKEINMLLPDDSRLTLMKEVEPIYKLKKRGNGKVIKQKVRMYLMICRCGKEVVLDKYQATCGKTKSCGCYKIECNIKNATKYSHNIKPLNGCYRCMMARCYNPKSGEYKRYGARGVRVCDEWRDSYQSFLDWALNSGWQKGLQLDKDIKGDGLLYSPETCKWVTPKENSRLTRHCHKINYDGEILNLKEICLKEDLNYNIIQKKYKNGMSIYQCVYTYKKAI